ncbi:ABC transporter permease [Janibacter limosus]|uniref:ABC transporter permease n=1 Tax=Janibacter limosus TaxID=53458 RepID=UPI00082E8F74|nr:ABC transporter permease [Janibacter limosus]
MRPPLWLWLPAAGAILVVVVPLLGLISSVDVGSLWPLLTSEASVTALLLSLRTSVIATALCILLGAPLALLLARGSWRGQSALRALVLVPLVLPPVVGGLALLTTFGRRGLLGEHLVAAGLSISYSTTAVVLAQTFVALPFLVLSLEGAVRGLDQRHEEAAATLGASPWRRLTRVTLPLVAPGLLSGSVLAFARALGEFGATLTFAGSAQGRTRTLPLEIYLQREVDPDAAIALSLVLVVLATVIVGSVYARTTRAAA